MSAHAVPARLAAWQSGNGAVQAGPSRLRPVARVPRTSVRCGGTSRCKNMTDFATACGGWPRPACCRRRAGQPVKAWARVSLADLMLLNGDSALQENWTEQVRAPVGRPPRGRGPRPARPTAPGWTGTPPRPSPATRRWPPSSPATSTWTRWRNLVRLCVELDKLRQDGESRPGTTAARAALEQAVIGKTVILLLHSLFIA